MNSKRRLKLEHKKKVKLKLEKKLKNMKNKNYDRIQKLSAGV